MKLLGIIPARGGSKGIPHKNLQLLDNKPLLMHAVDAAVDAHVFDRIIVSSDDDAIIRCAKQNLTIEVPFKRPAELAADQTPMRDVITHLLQWLKEQENYQPDAFMLLEPTCPLRNADDIRQAVALFQASDQPALISLSPVQQHPSDMIHQQEDGWHYCLARQKQTAGRHDFNSAWFINGAIYITQTAYFLATQQIYELNHCAHYKMPRERSFDIDTPFDLALVRAFTQSVSLPTQEREDASI